MRSKGWLVVLFLLFWIFPMTVIRKGAFTSNEKMENGAKR